MPGLTHSASLPKPCSTCDGVRMVVRTERCRVNPLGVRFAARPCPECRPDLHAAMFPVPFVERDGKLAGAGRDA